jgi:hypothetical protein
MQQQPAQLVRHNWLDQLLHCIAVSPLEIPTPTTTCECDYHPHENTH